MRISSERFLGLIHVWETEPMCFGKVFSHYEPPEQLQLSLALILQVFDFYWRNQQILLKDVPYLYLFLFYDGGSHGDMKLGWHKVNV